MKMKINGMGREGEMEEGGLGFDGCRLVQEDEGDNILTFHSYFCLKRLIKWVWRGI